MGFGDRPTLQFAFLVFVAAPSGCEDKRSREPVVAPPAAAAASRVAPSPSAPPPVRTYGSLRGMMHDGATEPQVSLATVLGAQVYAVGALSELRGEVTVVDGRATLAYPSTGETLEIVEATESAEAAALLVSATVPEWQTVEVAEDIPYETLDGTIEELAAARGVDTRGRFAVLVRGGLADVQWHVIDGARATSETVHSHEGHRRMAVRGELAESEGTLVGFFSKNDEGVFTHMGSSTHLHVVDLERGVSGHVDSVRIRKGASLSFPEQG